MTFWILWALFMLMVSGLFIGIIILLVLAIRALWKRVNLKPWSYTAVTDEKTLADILKENRMRCKMTQEFVAESLGKWDF